MDVVKPLVLITETRSTLSVNSVDVVKPMVLITETRSTLSVNSVHVKHHVYRR